MCPNCILNQVGLAPGVYVAFAICAIFFVAALAAMWWAFSNGEFDDIEASKFDMLDDEYDGEKARQIRAAVDRARARARG